MKTLMLRRKRRPFVAIAGAISLSLGIAAAQQQPPQSSPTFRTEAELVIVDAVVVDGSGNPVPDLTAADFEVRDEDVPQKVQLFQTIAADPRTAPDDGRSPAERNVPGRISTNVGMDARATRTFMLFFDDLHLTRDVGERAKTALLSFIDRELRDGDLVSLIVPGRALRWHARMPRGRAQLMEIVRSLGGLYAPDPSNERMSDYEAYRIAVFQDDAVAQRVERRWRNLRVAGREPVDVRLDRGFEPQNRGGNVGIIKEDIAIRANAVYTQAAARNRATLVALERAVDSLTSVRGRKSLILVSPGFIDDQERRDSRLAIHAARSANVAVYFVDARGLLAGTGFSQAEAAGPVDFRDIAATNADITLEAEGAETLAVQTGGFSVRNQNDLEAGLNRIARESQIYYLLGYQPTQTSKPGTFRRVEVRVTRPDLKVRARRGYYVGAPPASAKKDAAAIGVDRLERAAESPYDLTDIPLRASALVFGDAAPGTARTMIAVEADLRAFAFEKRGGQLVDVLELRMLAAHQETGVTENYERQVEMTFPATTRFAEDSWHTVTQEFSLAPGRYQSRVAVRDRNSGRIGSVTCEFEVPPLAGLRVTTPILTDTVESPSFGSQSPPRPVLVVRRAFPAGSTLYYQFSVVGAARDLAAAPRVAASHEIRRSDGSTVKRIDLRPMTPSREGGLSRFSGISLAGMDAGQYELVLKVVDQIAERTVEVREPFAILPTARVAGTP
jgi:VWFA-related protein